MFNRTLFSSVFALALGVSWIGSQSKALPFRNKKPATQLKAISSPSDALRAQRINELVGRNIDIASWVELKSDYHKHYGIWLEPIELKKTMQRTGDFDRLEILFKGRRYDKWGRLLRKRLGTSYKELALAYKLKYGVEYTEEEVKNWISTDLRLLALKEKSEHEEEKVQKLREVLEPIVLANLDATIQRLTDIYNSDPTRTPLKPKQMSDALDNTGLRRVKAKLAKNQKQIEQWFKILCAHPGATYAELGVFYANAQTPRIPPLSEDAVKQRLIDLGLIEYKQRIDAKLRDTEQAMLCELNASLAAPKK